jgi:hypothetical protein
MNLPDIKKISGFLCNISVKAVEIIQPKSKKAFSEIYLVPSPVQIIDNYH